MLKLIYKEILRNLLNFAMWVKISNSKSESYKTVIVIVPHPDDEIFGLGGFLIKMLNKGCKIVLVFLTDGEGSEVWPDREEIRKHRTEISDSVATILGINYSDIYRMHLPDSNVPYPGYEEFNITVLKIKSIIDSYRPDAVFTTHYLDYWPFDHVACSKIAIEAVEKADTKVQLWFFWVWAWYNLKPWDLSFGRFMKLRKIDIKDQLIYKQELVHTYMDHLTPDGKPWSGIVPGPLLKAFRYSYEIVERIS